MNTKTMVEEYRMAHWAGVMRERQASGLSIKAFCENAGFHENRYYYWQKKLREAVSVEMSKVAAETRCGSEVTHFAEVKLQEGTGMSPSSTKSNNQVIIEGDRVRISASGEYAVEKLAVLLRELRWQP